jgi:hypothetical protein
MRLPSPPNRFGMLVALSLSGLGCAGAQASSNPEQVLTAYANALRAGRLDEAYSLLSEDAKKNIHFEQFKRIAQENPEQIQELARALTRPKSSPPRVTATVTALDGQVLLLVYDGGVWRVDGSAIDLYSQATPEAALAAFVRALANKRYDVLLRFVPDAEREGLSVGELKTAWEGEQKDEMTRLGEALKTALPSARFEVVGDRATMAYGAGGTVELLREHGNWKLEELK